MAQEKTESENSTKLTIHVKDAHLPSDNEQQFHIMHELEQLVADALLENHGIKSEKVYSGVGHEFTKIYGGCPEPECDGSLDIEEIDQNLTSEAHGNASCSECGCVVHTHYALINLRSENNDDSEVEKGNVRPQYFIY